MKKRIVINTGLTQLLTRFAHKIKFITREGDLQIKIIDLKLINLLFLILKIQNLMHQLKTLPFKLLELLHMQESIMRNNN